MEPLVNLCLLGSQLTELESQDFMQKLYETFGRDKIFSCIFEQLFIKYKENKQHGDDLQIIISLISTILNSRQDEKSRENKDTKDDDNHFNTPPLLAMSDDMLSEVTSYLTVNEHHKLERCSRQTYVTFGALLNQKKTEITYAWCVEKDRISEKHLIIGTGFDHHNFFFRLHRYIPLRSFDLDLQLENEDLFEDFSLSKIPSCFFDGLQQIRIASLHRKNDDADLLNDLQTISTNLKNVKSVHLADLSAVILSSILSSLGQREIIIPLQVTIGRIVESTISELDTITFPPNTNGIWLINDIEAKIELQNPDGLEILHVPNLKSFASNNISLNNIKEMCIENIDENDMIYLNSKMKFGKLKRLNWSIDSWSEYKLKIAEILFNESDLSYICINTENVKILMEMRNIFMESNLKSKVKFGTIKIGYWEQEDVIICMKEICLNEWKSDVLVQFMDHKETKDLQITFRFEVCEARESMQMICCRCCQCWKETKR